MSRVTKGTLVVTRKGGLPFPFSEHKWSFRVCDGNLEITHLARPNRYSQTIKWDDIEDIRYIHGEAE